MRLTWSRPRRHIARARTATAAANAIVGVVRQYRRQPCIAQRSGMLCRIGSGRSHQFTAADRSAVAQVPAARCSDQAIVHGSNAPGRSPIPHRSRSTARRRREAAVAPDCDSCSSHPRGPGMRRSFRHIYRAGGALRRADRLHRSGRSRHAGRAAERHCMSRNPRAARWCSRSCRRGRVRACATW